MMALQQTTSKQADKWAPIILGAVLGLIFSGLLTAGISGWQMYRAASLVQQTSTVPTVVPAGTYAAPAGPYAVPGAYAPYNSAGESNTPGTVPTIGNGSATGVYGAAAPGTYVTPSTSNPYGDNQVGSTSPQPVLKPQVLEYQAAQSQDDTPNDEPEQAAEVQTESDDE